MMTEKPNNENKSKGRPEEIRDMFEVLDKPITERTPRQEQVKTTKIIEFPQEEIFGVPLDSLHETDLSLSRQDVQAQSSDTGVINFPIHDLKKAIDLGGVSSVIRLLNKDQGLND